MRQTRTGKILEEKIRAEENKTTGSAGEVIKIIIRTRNIGQLSSSLQ